MEDFYESDGFDTLSVRNVPLVAGLPEVVIDGEWVRMELPKVIKLRDWLNQWIEEQEKKGEE